MQAFKLLTLMLVQQNKSFEGGETPSWGQHPQTSILRNLASATLAFWLGGGWGGFAQAVQLGDGTVYFNYPPRLLGATTTNSDASSWGGTYHFTLAIPENAGEPLQSVIISQQAGFNRDLEYDLKRTYAFEGKSYRKKAARFDLGEVRFDRKTQTVMVRFDPPVPPGKTVTIGLTAYYNPDVGGVYLFGVSAAPAGENVHHQFLGFGRLHFYDRRGYGRWLWP
jgi:hypothetical protein